MPAPPLDKMLKVMVESTSPRPEDGWTLGWDVVVSYSEKEVNATLKKAGKRNAPWKHRDEMITKIEAKVFLDVFGSDSDSSDDSKDKPFQAYRLDVHAPIIQFVSNAQIPAADLVIPVASGTYERSDKPGKLRQLHTNAYQIRIKGIPIGTVTGTYKDVKGNQRAGNPLDVEQGDKECLFRNSAPDRAEDDFEVSWVVLNFPLQQQGLVVKAEIVPGYTTDPTIQKSLNKHLKHIQTASETWFEGTQENGRHSFNLIRHALATIKNKALPKQEGISLDLTPSKFSMATCSGSFIEDPILSLFIHVVGGKDQGETKDLQSAWQGQWMTAKPDKIAPIPNDYTASVLFHPKIIVENVLLPSMMEKDQDDWKLEPLSGYGGGGIAVNATWKKIFDLDWFWIPYGRILDSMGEKNQLKLEVCGPTPKDLQNKTTFSIDHDFPLEIKTTDYDATFDINTEGMESHWKVDDEPMAKEGGVWQTVKDFFEIKSIPPTPEIYEQRKKKLAGVSPKFHFKKMGLGYFLTTNLLNPGSKVIEIDKRVGMRFPGNMLLVGRVVQGVDSITGKA
ncbi:hypothetical protein N7532_007688 [Penicillium argentinense]|uniref:Uncharacterized protein n=1 Tax=Penicillium argentinense TaxID=1131581 RepID=A0A9W9EW43_9EURO|nr:uncharacterized protein N7532_007688 [Penicillium argentinense]KAJ5089004.1 hypothetical protein N7532_007688 [Penicillium argentinense]